MEDRLPIQVRRMITLGILLAGVLGAFALVNYGNARRLRLHFLENRATGLATTIEALARRTDAREPEELRRIFEEFGSDPGLAYLQLIDRDGRALAGVGTSAYPDMSDREQTAPDSLAGDVLRTQQPAGRIIVLADGSRIYEAYLPFHLGTPGHPQSEGQSGSNSSASGQPRFRVLRVGLLTRSADHLVRPALIQVWVAAAVIIAFLVAAVGQTRTLRRYFALLEKSRRQENLAALGLVSAGVAHEIRNPLGSIKGLAQLINEGRVSDEDQSLYLRTILKETTRLEQVVNELLEFARPKEPNRSPTPIGEVIGEVVGELSNGAATQGVRIDTAGIDFGGVNPGGINPIADVDRGLLRQVFSNLASNALQAMPDGGVLEIEIDRTPHSIRIMFSDRGPGIRPGDEERIFQPFFTTREKGIGLGLALCRQIVEAHGGSISAANRPGGGAVFTIILPGGENR